MKQKEIFDLIIERMIDNTREKMLRNDAEYQSLEAKRAELEKKYLQTAQKDMEKAEKYIEIVQETDMRFADVSYMSAIKDTVYLMFKLNLIKE